MAGLQVKSFRNADETRIFEKGRADIVTLADVTMARTIAQPGWRWSEHIRPLAGTISCQLHHLGFVVRGRLRVALDDGTTREVGPEDVYDIPPGHDAWVVGDDELELFDYAGAMGRGLQFVDRGSHELKGPTGRRQVYALARDESAPTVDRIPDA